MSPFRQCDRETAYLVVPEEVIWCGVGGELSGKEAI